MCVLLNLFKMSRHLADHDYHCVEEVAEAMEAMEVSSASEDEEGKRREQGLPRTYVYAYRTRSRYEGEPAS